VEAEVGVGGGRHDQVGEEAEAFLAHGGASSPSSESSRHPCRRSRRPSPRSRRRRSRRRSESSGSGFVVAVVAVVVGEGVVPLGCRDELAGRVRALDEDLRQLGVVDGRRLLHGLGGDRRRAELGGRVLAAAHAVLQLDVVLLGAGEGAVLDVLDDAGDAVDRLHPLLGLVLPVVLGSHGELRCTPASGAPGARCARTCRPPAPPSTAFSFSSWGRCRWGDSKGHSAGGDDGDGRDDEGEDRDDALVDELAAVLAAGAGLRSESSSQRATTCSRWAMRASSRRFSASKWSW
jgi:hypothetical protein